MALSEQPSPIPLLSGRDFLCLADFSRTELAGLLELARRQKAEWKAGGHKRPPLAGKSLAMIFEKPSTRTRVSFEVGMQQLGGHVLYLSPKDLQMGRGETVGDTGRVLSRYVDAIMIRAYSHAMVEELAEAAEAPVINGLTDRFHPCQIMADLLTILEHKGTLSGLTVAFIGDGNNVAHSWLLGAALFGLHFHLAAPEGYEPDPGVLQQAETLAAASGSRLRVLRDPAEAAEGADVLYTDVWTSMGQEEENQIRARAFAPYQVNEALAAKAAPDYLFMHCLPAHRGEEVTAGVIDGPHSIVFDQAENRLHAQKAILTALLGGADETSTAAVQALRP